MLRNHKNIEPFGSIEALLAQPRVIEQMEQLSRSQRPAVQAIGKQIASLAPDLDDPGRQRVGRMVRDAMAERGWVQDRSKRVQKGHFFSYGMVYRRSGPNGAGLRVSNGDSASPTMSRVRAMLQRKDALPSVDEFLDDRTATWAS